MNNKQRASARRVLNQYPDIRAQEVGGTLTLSLKSNDATKSDMDVPANMDTRELERSLNILCASLT